MSWDKDYTYPVTHLGCLMFSDSLIRLAPFLLTLLVMASLEQVYPWRRATQNLARRWRNHLALQAIAIVLLRVFLPVSLVTVALWSGQQGIGLFAVWSLPPFLASVISIFLLDLCIYAQHRLSHAWPLFWRLHRLHHSDRVLDVTTALRFHPLEMFFSMMWKMLVVVALGAPAQAVLLFEILLSSSALFNHANIRLYPRLDTWLRRVLVTPDMHRVHHSRRPEETDTNFGFLVPWWDWLFSSYRAVSAQGNALEIGLNTLHEDRDNSIPGMLSQPWR